jgi:hypothetical protein
MAEIAITYSTDKRSFKMNSPARKEPHLYLEPDFYSIENSYSELVNLIFLGCR